MESRKWEEKEKEKTKWLVTASVNRRKADKKEEKEEAKTHSI